MSANPQHPEPPELPKQQSIPRYLNIIGWISLVLVVLVCLFAGLFQLTDAVLMRLTPEQYKEYLENQKAQESKSQVAMDIYRRNSAIEYAVKDAVRARMKDPNSLKFESLELYTTDNESRFIMKGLIRAKNSFGAVIPQTFTSTIECADPKKATVISVIFDQD